MSEQKAVKTVEAEGSAGTPEIKGHSQGVTSENEVINSERVNAEKESDQEAVKTGGGEGPAETSEVKAVSSESEVTNSERVISEKEREWNQKEADLIKKIEELENVHKEAGVEKLQLELKYREEEVELLRARVTSLESELQAALTKPGPKNQDMIESIKHQHEELLRKAKGMIFDKTKMVKNQELQIEALMTQVQSLKDINMITKNLLEIRNGEVKAMEDRLEAMEGRFKAEKERYTLVLKKAEASSGLNNDLKQEYVTQLGLFKELRQKYDERVQALVAENEKLKLDIKSESSSTSV